MEPTLRDATEDDLDEIRAIYDHYVLTSTCTFQLERDTREARARWFAQHGPKHPILVAELDAAIVGWAALSIYNPREGYAATVEDSIYVRDGFHRRGIGRTLLGALLDRGRALGHHVVVAGVAGDQSASVALHASFGFEHAGRLREVGVKFGRVLDVIYMQKFL